MSEGRRSQVVLLDERRLDLIIQSRLYAGELLDIVASHFNIKEKEYFGITFIDDTGQSNWLQLDKRVLEHDLPKKAASQGATLIFYFKIKYFVESITQLYDSATIEAFYLQAKSLVSKGDLDIDSETTFQLAALVLQATFGDFVDESSFKSYLKRLPVLPASSLKDFPSISQCEDKVVEHYKSLCGQTRGDAIVNYLSILESIPTYGQHFYDVKDKSGNLCCLGLSHRGICEYDKYDKKIPKRVFLWKQLENLYFRDKKFTVEVHEARRVVHTLSSFNLYEDAIEEPVEEFDDLSNAICDPTTQVSVSRRALAPASVTVYVWYAASSNIAKCIWSMAIAQHQFFLDRNHRKVNKNRNGVVRSLSQIASELSRSAQSLSSASSVSNISRSNSSTSLPNTVIEGELSEESKAATIEMLTALQSRKDALQETLKKKTEELKALCLKEGELTGELPPETPLQPGEPQPQIRRRVGTSFTLSDKLVCRAKNKDRETLTDLELDYEIQSKIASAALKLATDITARKSVRKLRKVSYQQATDKLRDIEEKLCTLKGEKDAKKKSPDAISEGSGSDRFRNHLKLPASSSENSIADRNGNSPSSGLVIPSTSLPQLSDAGAYASSPSSPAKCRQRHQSLQHVPVITTEVYEDTLPPNVRVRRNSSTYSAAASEYDAVSCGSSSIASLGIPYRNRFEANLNIDGSNLYSVPNRRASQAFNDPEELYLDDTSSQYCGNGLPEQYANVSALSSSFDERMFHQNLGFPVIPESRSTTDSLFDKHSVKSNGACYYDASYQMPGSCDFPVQDKYAHSHNNQSVHSIRGPSLHQKLDHIHISEPNLNFTSSQPDIHNVHHLRVPTVKNVIRPTSTIFPANSSIASCQSIHKVAEMVQASVLLQDSKRTTSSGCLEHSSPKAKTKEWTETSLDSPVVARRQKPKHSEHSPPTHHETGEWVDNGLPQNCAADHQRFGYPNQIQYVDDLSASNHSFSKYSDSPIQYVGDNCQNVGVQKAYSLQNSERIYVNTNEMNCDKVYHHYENTAELSSNQGRYPPQNSLYMETISNDYNANLQKILPDILSTHKPLSDFDDTLSKPAIAEPQQPSKHQLRRINTEDIFPNDNISTNEPDYENIPMDNEYEPIEFKSSTSLSYEGEQCDVLDSSNYSHDNTQSSRDSQSENWQHSSLVQSENPALSPGSQSINFSPTVEVNVVSVGHFQPYWEETKPYELSDFYKYSTKHRRLQKNSTSVPTEGPASARKDIVENSPQTFELNPKDCSQFQDHHYSNEVLRPCPVPSTNPHPEIVTSHVPVFGSSAHLESPAKYYAVDSVSSPSAASDPNKSLSFGEIQISIAENFHDEMVQWYQNQDAVKKATLV